MSEIKPFEIHISDEEIADLKRRLASTRWPDAETVDDWSQGIPLSYVKEVCEYWAGQYDWREREARLNRFPQFKTEIEGLDIHFIHVRSPEPDAQPLVVTHGWPGSIVEFLDVLPALTDPEDPADAFHVVVPTLPGFGFSGKPAVAGWGVERIAVAWAQLMDRLGYDRFAAQGGDWGSMITSALGTAAPEMLHGIHLTMALAPKPDDDDQPLTEQEKRDIAFSKDFERYGTGYSTEQRTRPQTIGYGLVDSPVAQCTWIVEKFWDWTDCAGRPENTIRRDRLLDNVMTYWLTGSAASSARLYWESYGKTRYDLVEVPTGATVFPHEMRRLPRHWLERRFTDLRMLNHPEVGGHFASMEQPEVLVDDIRTFFRMVR